MAAYGAEKKVTILELRQNPDPEIAALADYVYEHVFVHYTMKQWGQTPEEIDPNTTARVPVFLSGTAAISRTPTRACPWRATPPCSSRCWTTPTSRWSWGWTLRPAGPAAAVSSLWTEQPFSGPVIYTGAGGRAVRLRVRPPALPHPGLPV